MHLFSLRHEQRFANTIWPNSDSMFAANWACTLLRIELEEKRGNGCASNKTKNSYGCFFAPHVGLTSELWSRRNRIPRPCFDRCFLVCCFIPALPQLEIPESSREAYKTSNRILYRFFISGKGYRLVKFDPNTIRREKHVWKHRSVIFLKANANESQESWSWNQTQVTEQNCGYTLGNKNNSNSLSKIILLEKPFLLAAPKSWDHRSIKSQKKHN